MKNIIDNIAVQKWTPLQLVQADYNKSKNRFYNQALSKAFGRIGYAQKMTKTKALVYFDELGYSVEVPVSWLCVSKDKMMKTVLPLYIKTVAAAKKFLTDLINNDEVYHPEDDADTIYQGTKKLFLKREADQLNNLMTDISKLKNFDPCEFILSK